MISRKVFWLSIFVFYNTFVILHCVKKWDGKQLFPSSRIPEDGLNPRRSVVRRKIVLYHNFFRTKVRPTASNMLLMSWHPLAARQAQQYADRCIFLQHNDPRENTVPHLGSCGQNIFVASQKTPWFFAIKTWFLEYKKFTYGAPIRDLKAVGHYTQMVWATSHRVGCGVAHCAGGPWGYFYNYVCHYCPAGNINTINEYPYKIGEPCGDCKDSCISDGLCLNSCPVKDFFSNCKDLVTATNACQLGMCNATCVCGNDRLHRNYPW